MLSANALRTALQREVQELNELIQMETHPERIQVLLKRKLKLLESKENQFQKIARQGE